MINRSRVLVVLALFFLTHMLEAQDDVFILNQFTPLLYQPAAPAVDQEATLSYLWDLHDLPSLGADFQTHVLNSELPLIKSADGNCRLGVGLGFFRNAFDQSSTRSTINEISLSLAGSFQLAENHYLAFGASGSFIDSRLYYNPNSFRWGAPPIQLDPGDDGYLLRNRENSFSLGTGVRWSMMEQEQERVFASLSFFQLNRPTDLYELDGFYRRPINSLLQAGAILVRTERFSFEPSVITQYTSGQVGTQFFTSSKLLLKNGNPRGLIGPGSLELLVGYNMRTRFEAGLVIHQPYYRLGGSFGFPDGEVLVRETRFNVALGLRLQRW